MREKARNSSLWAARGVSRWKLRWEGRRVSAETCQISPATREHRFFPLTECLEEEQNGMLLSWITVGGHPVAFE